MFCQWGQEKCCCFSHKNCHIVNAYTNERKKVYHKPVIKTEQKSSYENENSDFSVGLWPDTIPIKKKHIYTFIYFDSNRMLYYERKHAPGEKKKSASHKTVNKLAVFFYSFPHWVIEHFCSNYRTSRIKIKNKTTRAKKRQSTYK